MDSFDSLSFGSDSTIALIEEAQHRGHQVFVFIPDTLCLSDNIVTAFGHNVTLHARGHNPAFSLSEPRRVDLNIFDVVLARQEPPFDMHYITTTYLLQKLCKTVLLINDVRAIRDAPEKILITEFPELMPSTMISKDIECIKEFRRQHNDIVIKPLYGHAGRSVLHLRPDDENIDALLEIFATQAREPLIVQKFIDDVYEGDKRIFLIDGEFAGGINRIPASGNFRSNLIAGAKAHPLRLQDEKRVKQICNIIGETLRNRGLYFCGIDVIGSYVTEINVTCPTGIRQYHELSGINIASHYWNGIEKKMTVA